MSVFWIGVHLRPAQVSNRLQGASFEVECEWTGGEHQIATMGPCGGALI